jgi:hypothetical protein
MPTTEELAYLRHRLREAWIPIALFFAIYAFGLLGGTVLVHFRVAGVLVRTLKYGDGIGAWKLFTALVDGARPLGGLIGVLAGFAAGLPYFPGPVMVFYATRPLGRRRFFWIQYGLGAAMVLVSLGLAMVVGVLCLMGFRGVVNGGGVEAVGAVGAVLHTFVLALCIYGMVLAHIVTRRGAQKTVQSIVLLLAGAAALAIMTKAGTNVPWELELLFGVIAPFLAHTRALRRDMEVQ